MRSLVVVMVLVASSLFGCGPVAGAPCEATELDSIRCEGSAAMVVCVKTASPSRSLMWRPFPCAGGCVETTAQTNTGVLITSKCSLIGAEPGTECLREGLGYCTANGLNLVSCKGGKFESEYCPSGCATSMSNDGRTESVCRQ